MNKTLVASDFHSAATILNVDPFTIMAVAEIESAGGGFLPDGRPKILFEAHVFSRLTKHVYDELHPNISSSKWTRSLYRGGAAEHDVRLEEAVRLDRPAALQSASWGMFQIMGFNFKRCGFPSVQAFVNAMYISEAQHLNAFCRLVKSMGLDDELQRRDWAAFANGYNGPSFATNHYDSKLEASYARLISASTPDGTRLV